MGFEKKKDFDANFEPFFSLNLRIRTFNFSIFLTFKNLIFYLKVLQVIKVLKKFFQVFLFTT